MDKNLTFSQCMTHLWTFLRPNKLKLFGGLAATIMLSAIYVVMPFQEGKITSQLQLDLSAMHQGLQSEISWPVIIHILQMLCLIYALKCLLQFASVFLLTDAIQKTVYDLRLAVMEKIGTLPVGYFDRHPAGELLSRITNDTDTVSIALQQTLARIVSAICTLSFCFAMMFSINVVMACMVLAAMPVIGAISVLIMKKAQPHFDEKQKLLADLNSMINEMYTGNSEITANSCQNKARASFGALSDEMAVSTFKGQFLSGTIMPATSLVTYLVIGCCALYGSFQVLQAGMLLGSLQAFIRYIWNVSEPISQLSQLSSAIQSSLSGMNRLFSFLALPGEEECSQKADVKTVDSIKFEDVSFSYTDKPLMEHISFDVKAGQTVAIVGPTGAGKTTLTNLLLRFYDPDAGKITINGIDIQSMPRHQLRDLMGLVLQDAWLFEGSIHDNLAYANDGATADQIHQAARLTGLDEVIEEMPDKYETILHDGALSLSQGQRQLMTIARALVKDPQILILDEATSSVDTRMERKLQNAMDALMKERTCFVIAHRLSTIIHADLILVVENGTIRESGTHESLLEKNGLYARLYNSQFQDCDDLSETL